VRVNKAFKDKYSRREADGLVDAGRVAINGVRAYAGDRLHPGDTVTLDGVAVGWERLAAPVVVVPPPTDAGDGGDGGGDGDGAVAAAAAAAVAGGVGDTTRFTYLKLHKPVDVVTTTASSTPNNIIRCLREAGHAGRDRVFPVGRLDEATSGVILLTSDGTLVNAALGGGARTDKVYLVRTDAVVTDAHVADLRAGVVIKTVAQYARGRAPLAAPTRPCGVERASPPPGASGDGGGGPSAACWLRMTLQEGRNRQIRKMLGAVGGYTVRAIHRVSFMGIGLGGVEAPGSYAPLDEREMGVVREVIVRKAEREAAAAAEAAGGEGGARVRGRSQTLAAEADLPPLASFASDGEYW